MDFESLINGMISSGTSEEEIAKNFTETLNRLSAANKRKEEVEEYLENARDAIYNALMDEAEFDFDISAKALVIAAAAYRPDLSMKDLRMLEDGTRDANKMSVDLICSLNKKWDESKATSKSDDEALMKFLRTLK